MILKKQLNSNLYLALIHYPVVNKNGEKIVSAVTNLDLHDIARAAKTYGIKKFYIVTPLKDQKELVNKILFHWKNGYGAKYNPKRSEALELIDVCDTLEDVLSKIKEFSKESPKTIVTSAKKGLNNLDCKQLNNKIKLGMSCLLIFGTAWGLSNSIIEKADFILEPILGNTEYNHLSVRSAVSIILDRLLGRNNI